MSKFYTKKSINDVMKYLLDRQLLSQEMWDLFVKQFADKTDKAENGGWRGEYWGKTMRGAVLVYRFTNDEKLYALLEKTVKDIIALKENDGRISSYKKEDEFKGWDMWCRKYIAVGLEYFLSICKDASLKKDILSTLCGHLDYIITHVGKGEGQIAITDTTNWWGGLNSCSILKAFVVAYELTSESKYLDFARYIASTGACKDFDVFKAALDDKLRPAEYKYKKAYEMTSCFEGLLELYRVDKEQKYLNTCVNFAEALAKYEMTIVGCAGCNVECFNDSVITQTLPRKKPLQETCVTVSLMLYFSEIYKETANPVYLRYIDLAYKNAYLGALNNACTDVNAGLPFDSYAPLTFGKRGGKAIAGKMELGNGSYYSCCSAMGAAGAGVYGELACFIQDKNIYINTTLPFSKCLKFGENEIKITAKSMSEDGKVSLSSKEKFVGKVFVLKPQKNVACDVNAPANSTYEITSDYVIISGDFDTNTTFSITVDEKYEIVKVPRFEGANYGVFCVKKGNFVYALDKRVANPKAIYFGDPLNAKITKKTANIECIDSLAVTFGKKDITFVDYASAGTTFKRNSAYSVWIPYFESGFLSYLKHLDIRKKR